MHPAIDSSVGKTISDISITTYETSEGNQGPNSLARKFDDGSWPILRIGFTDGSALMLFNHPEDRATQSITCDDDLALFQGAEFRTAEIRNVEETSVDGAEGIQDDECHSIGFLVVETSQGSFTVASHSVHNGYYGQFSLGAEMDDRPTPTPPGMTR